VFFYESLDELLDGVVVTFVGAPTDVLRGRWAIELTRGAAP
jgi:hypothetical protein